MLLLLLGACGHAPSKPEDTAPPDTTTPSGDDTGDSAPPPGPASPDPTCRPGPWFVDADGDGVGVGSAVTVACEGPPGTAPATGDCDDTRATVYPGAPELATSGRPDDCDGVGAVTEIDEGFARRYTPGVGWTLDVGSLLGKGAPFDLAIGYGSGHAAVIAGPLSGEPGTEDVDAAVTTLIQATAPQYVDEVLIPGDLDGDGADELFLLTRRSDDILWQFRGPLLPGEFVTADADLELRDDPDFPIYAPSKVGDLDGDGLDEVAFSDPYYGEPYDSGHVFILLGPAEQTSLRDADLTLTGAPLASIGANRTRPLGDLTGDGTADYALCKGWAGCYVVTRHEDGLSMPDVAVDLLWEDLPGSSSAMSATLAGDISGDGAPDLWMSSWGSYATALLFGPLPATGTLDVATEADTWLLSTNGGFENGENFATTLGDWDGDGFEDREDASPWDLVYTGALFLLAGPVAPGVVDLEVQADRVENRGLAGWEFGLDHAVAGGHDLDLDGHPDLVVGDSGDQYPGIWTLFGGGR